MVDTHGGFDEGGHRADPTSVVVGEVVDAGLDLEGERVLGRVAPRSSGSVEPVVVGIDEGQFFDIGLVEVATLLANAGKQVIVAGLDLDYLGRPVEPIPSLMLRAEYVTKSLAVCHRCGGPGLFTQRVVDSDELVEVTPNAIRLRKRHLDPHERKRAARGKP